MQDLKLKSSDPNIWRKDDAKNIFQEIKNIEKKISDFDKLSQLLNETEEIYNYIQKNEDNSLLDELRKEVAITLKESKTMKTNYQLDESVLNGNRRWAFWGF